MPSMGLAFVFQFTSRRNAIHNNFHNLFLIYLPANKVFMSLPVKDYLSRDTCMVGEMVQNSQSLYSFTFNAVIVIHVYFYSLSTTEFTFKKYIYSHLPVYFLFTIIFAHIYEMSSFTFNVLYSFTFTIEIFIQHFLRTTFAHH